MDIQTYANADDLISSKERPSRPTFIPVKTWENNKTEGNASFLRAARAGNIDKVQDFLRNGQDINTANANGLNALHLASKEGHVDLVRLLLQRGAAVDAATRKGNTSLHIGCLAGQTEIVKILIDHGGSVNVQSQNGFTPLYMAAQENHVDIVRYLLEHGANQSLATEDGFTPLAVALQQGHDKVVSILLESDTRSRVRLPALHIAAKKDDVRAATLLLDSDQTGPDVTSKSGFTPLHIAAHYGNVAIGTLLLDRGANVNFAASKHNITPLHVAAKWGRANMVELLLNRGAEIDAKTRDGLTPLHCGARSGHDRVVDLLLQKGSPNSPKTKNGLAPLHMAAQGDHVDSARALLYYKAPVDDVTVDYLTPLHVAAHCGHVRVAKLLLDRRADPNARALNGFTPLHIACKKNRIKVVELLLKHGASIDATTESGLTPLHVASFMGCMNIVLYLIQHGANPDVTTVRGETPLHLAVRSNQTDIIRILLRNGAKVDAKARENQTPLHIATRLGHLDNAALLIQHGAVIDIQTKDLYTPLHIAAKEGQEEVAMRLIEQGASLTATTRKGFTPLHLAAKYGHLNLVKLFLDKGAAVDTQGKNGVTPLHVAAHYDNVQVAHLLLQRGASPQATAKNGYTPLHISAKKNQLDIANSLIKYKADPNAESKAGFTPVHLASQEGHTEMLYMLVKNGGDVNARAKNGLAPLHLAAQEDHVPIGEILVQNKAELNPETKAGYTPLHVASHFGQLNMVRFLLDQGADVNLKTSYGYTPLHQAAQQGQTQVVNVLLQHQAQPNEVSNQGQTALSIAEKLGYVSVVETLKVVTETIVTTTTTTVTEEKLKVQQPESMQEAFISDSEDEADKRMDDEEDEGLARYSPDTDRIVYSPTPPERHQVMIEEHVVHQEVPGTPTRARNPKVTTTTITTLIATPSIRKDRSKSPDYHAELSYEDSAGIPLQGAYDDEQNAREHYTEHVTHEHIEPTEYEHTIHTRSAPRGDRSTGDLVPYDGTDEQIQYQHSIVKNTTPKSPVHVTSDYKQYETTTKQVTNIESRGYAPRHVPDVVVLTERTESRSGMTSPMQVRTGEYSEAQRVPAMSAQDNENFIRFELVAPPTPPSRKREESPLTNGTKKKRRWFSFGSRDKSRPAAENEAETSAEKTSKDKSSKKRSKSSVAESAETASKVTKRFDSPQIETLHEDQTESSLVKTSKEKSSKSKDKSKFKEKVAVVDQQFVDERALRSPNTVESIDERSRREVLPDDADLTMERLEQRERAYKESLERAPNQTVERLGEAIHQLSPDSAKLPRRTTPKDTTNEAIHATYSQFKSPKDRLVEQLSQGTARVVVDDDDEVETAHAHGQSIRQVNGPRERTVEQLKEYTQQSVEPDSPTKKDRGMAMFAQRRKASEVDSEDENDALEQNTQKTKVKTPKEKIVEMLSEGRYDSQVADDEDGRDRKYKTKPLNVKRAASPGDDEVEVLDESVVDTELADGTERSPKTERQSRGRTSPQVERAVHDRENVHLEENVLVQNIPDSPQTEKRGKNLSVTITPTATKKSSMKGSTPRSGATEHLDESVRSTSVEDESSAQKSPKKLQFARRSVSQQDETDTESETDDDQENLDESVHKDKIKRKPHVKRQKKVSKEGYEAVPTDEYLNERVSHKEVQPETSPEKVKSKKDKDRSMKERVVTTRPLNLNDEVDHERENLDEAVVIATSQNLSGVPLTDEYYQQESYRVKGSPEKTRKTSPGRQERIETEVITTVEPVEKTKTKVKPEKPPKPEKLKKAKTPEVPIQEVFVRIVDVTGALEEPETEEQRLAKKKLEKERAKQEKKFAEERDKAEKAAAKEREKAEKEAQKAAKKGSTERKPKDKEDRLERISEISEKQARLTPDDIEMIDENVSLRELTPTPELKTKVQRVSREKTPTRISIAEETERSRILDSGLGDSPVARSPSQPFSPVIKSPRVEAERQQRAEAVSPTMEQLKVGGHRSRSKSPAGDKTVVDLNEKVAKTKSPTRGDGEGEGDGRTHVELYETPWVPLNREEDRDDEEHTASSNKRINEVPATSPPEHTFNYMQEATRTYPDHPVERTMEGQALYASGYSEGKMSPQVEAKTSPVRVLAPPIAVPPTRVDNVYQENVRTEKRPKDNGYQETLYEDSVTQATQQPRKPSTSWNQKESFEQIIREAEARRADQPNYHAAIVGHEPETVRDDLHELEGTFAPDNVDLRMNAPIRGGKLRWKTFLVSFLVDARGGAMRGCRHSGIRVIIPPRKAPCPMRITCKYLTKDKVAIPPPLMEGEGLACRILEMGPLGAKFLGPVIIEIPHFASLRENEREVQILRSENGQTWREHTLEATEDAVQKVLNESFDPDELSAIEDLQTNRIIRILTTDFPLYFAIVSRIRQEVHAVGPDGGIITSTVDPQVQALFPEGALTKKIKVGVQAHVIPPDVVARLLASNRIAVSPIVTVEPRRRKFHKPITLTIPLPRAAGKGMVNQYTSDSPNLRLLCSITGGTTPAQWEDITGSTPLVIVNDCIQFTTTVSARFWLMDCGHNIPEAVRFGHAVYSDACVVPYMAKFVVYARRFDNEEARLRVFCMTDDKEDKTLEHQERFVEVSKSRDVEVLEGKNLYIEMAGNLIPVTKSGDQIHFPFYPFQENRLPFLVKVKDPNDDAQGRLAFMREAKSGRNDLPQTPICNLSVRLPDELSPMEPTHAKDLVTIVRRPVYMREIGKAGSVHKADVRLHDVADMVGSDWPALAQQLGFRDPEIQSLMDEEPKTNIQAFNMLRRWIARRDVTKSAGNELEQALKRTGRDDIVNKVMFNVKLLTDDLDRSMARLSVDRDQVGFDALHEEIGPGTSAVEGGTETFVRDYVRGYREPVRAESEPTSETTSLHEHVMEEEVGPNRTGESATTEVLHERVTQQRPPSPPQRQISQREKEEATSRLSSTMRSMDTPAPMRDVENTRETERLYETVSQREVAEPRAVEVRTLTGQVSPTAEVVVSREDVRRASPAEPTPPSPRTKPVPPPRHDQPHVQYAEHVSTFELPKETPTYVREAGVNESTPTVSEARRLSGPAPADDNAQKSTSQKQFETVETEHDEDGNLITKKTITTVKTTRSTRTITGDQDELIKQATEGELRNIPQSVLGDVQQQSRVDISGPEITDVTESYVRDNQPAEGTTVQYHAFEPASEDIPRDVETLMRQFETEPTTSRTPRDPQLAMALGYSSPVRPRRVQELAEKPIPSPRGRVASTEHRGSIDGGSTTDDLSYQTALESASEGSTYYTAREGRSASISSGATLISEGEVKQIESDAESVFSGYEQGLSGSRQTLVTAEGERSDRELTPVNEMVPSASSLDLVPEMVREEFDVEEGPNYFLLSNVQGEQAIKLQPEIPIVVDTERETETLVETVQDNDEPVFASEMTVTDSRMTREEFSVDSLNEIQQQPQQSSEGEQEITEEEQQQIETYNQSIDDTLRDMIANMELIRQESGLAPSEHATPEQSTGRNRSRTSLTIEEPIDRETVDALLEETYSPRSSRSRKESSDVVTSDEQSHAQELENLQLHESLPVQQTGEFPGEFLRRFIQERDRGRTFFTPRPLGVVINPDSPEFVQQMAAIVSEETHLLERRQQEMDDFLHEGPKQAIITPGVSTEESEVVTTRQYEEVDELGRTVRTTEEERLITETRRVVHHGPGAVQITEIPAEFTAASGGSQHEELSEHVEEMEVVGERQNNEASELLHETVSQVRGSSSMDEESSLERTADEVVKEAVDKAVEELEREDLQGETKATSPQRPSQLFAGGFSGAWLKVDSSTVPIIETPSTNVLIVTADFEKQGQLSPVELTENQPEFRDESLAETQMPIVEEPVGGMTPSAVADVTSPGDQPHASTTISTHVRDASPPLPTRSFETFEEPNTSFQTSSSGFKRTVQTTTVTSETITTVLQESDETAEKAALSRKFTYRQQQPHTPHGSLDIGEEEAPNRLELSNFQLRRLSEVADTQAEEERRMSLKERVAFFEKKAQEAKTPSPPSSYKSPSPPRREKTPSPPVQRSPSVTLSETEVGATTPSTPISLPREASRETTPSPPLSVAERPKSPSPPVSSRSSLDRSAPPSPPPRRIFSPESEQPPGHSIFAPQLVSADKPPLPPHRIKSPPTIPVREETEVAEDDKTPTPTSSRPQTPPSPPVRQIFTATEEEYTTVVTSRKPSPPPREVFVPPSPPPRTEPSPLLQRSHEERTSEERLQEVTETRMSSEASPTTEVQLHEEVTRSEPTEERRLHSERSSVSSSTTDEELREISQVEADLPSLATEVETLAKEQEYIAERVPSPDSPKEGHVREVVHRIESLISSQSVTSRLSERSRSSSTQSRTPSPPVPVATAAAPALAASRQIFTPMGVMDISDIEPEIRVTLMPAVVEHVETVTERYLKRNASEVASEPSSGSPHVDVIESDVSQDFDALERALKQEHDERQELDAHSSETEEVAKENRLISPMANLRLASFEEPLQEPDAAPTGFHTDTTPSSTPRSIVLSTSEEESSSSLQTSPRPAVFPIDSLHTTTTTTTRISSPVPDTQPIISPRTPAKLSPTNSSHLVEESMMMRSTSSSPATSPRQPPAKISPMDRPIFGGLSFPTPGPTEKRQLYLQEKMDRSRPTTPNGKLDRRLSGETSPTKIPPRQFESEILEESVSTAHDAPHNPSQVEESEQLSETVVKEHISPVISPVDTTLTIVSDFSTHAQPEVLQFPTAQPDFDASSMAVETSDTASQSTPSVSDHNTRQTSFEEAETQPEVPHDNTRQLHKSVSFGANQASSAASESLLKSLAHSSFESSMTTHATHTETTTAITQLPHSASLEQLEERVEVMEEPHTANQRRASIVDRFGETENIPGAIRHEREQQFSRQTETELPDRSEVFEPESPYAVSEKELIERTYSTQPTERQVPLEPASPYAEFGVENIQEAEEAVSLRAPRDSVPHLQPASPYAEFGTENIAQAEDAASESEHRVSAARLEPASPYAEFGQENIVEAEAISPKRSPLVPEGPYAEYGIENIHDAETVIEQQAIRRDISYENIAEISHQETPEEIRYTAEEITESVVEDAIGDLHVSSVLDQQRELFHSNEILEEDVMVREVELEPRPDVERRASIEQVIERTGPLEIHARSVQQEFDEAADKFVARFIRRASMGGDISPEDLSDAEQLETREEELPGRQSPPEFHTVAPPDVQLPSEPLIHDSDEESGNQTETELLDEHVTEIEVESPTEARERVRVQYNETVERTADELTDSVIRHAVESLITPEEIQQVVAEVLVRPVSPPRPLHLAAVLESRDISSHKRVSFDEHPIEIETGQVITETELSEQAETSTEVLHEHVTARRIHSPPPRHLSESFAQEELEEQVVAEHIPRRVSFDDYPVQISPSASELTLSSRESTQWIPNEEAVVEETTPTTPTLEMQPRSAYTEFGESNLQEAEETSPKRSPLVPESPYAEFGRENIEDAERPGETVLTTRRTSYGSAAPAIRPSEVYTEQLQSQEMQMSAPQRFSMTMGETEHLEETVTEQHVESPRTTEYLPTAEHAQERAVEVDQTLAPAPERIVCEFPPLDEVALHRARTQQDQDDEELSRETENVHSQVNEQPQEEFIVESTPLDEMALRHSRHASIDLSPEHLPDIREETRAEKRQGEREELQESIEDAEVDHSRVLDQPPERFVCEFPPLDEVALQRIRQEEMDHFIAQQEQRAEDEETPLELDVDHSGVIDQPPERFVCEFPPLDEAELRRIELEDIRRKPSEEMEGVPIMMRHVRSDSLTDTTEEKPEGLERDEAQVYEHRFEGDRSEQYERRDRDEHEVYEENVVEYPSETHSEQQVRGDLGEHERMEETVTVQQTMPPQRFEQREEAEPDELLDFPPMEHHIRRAPSEHVRFDETVAEHRLPSPERSEQTEQVEEENLYQRTEILPTPDRAAGRPGADLGAVILRDDEDDDELDRFAQEEAERLVNDVLDNDVTLMESMTSTSSSSQDTPRYRFDYSVDQESGSPTLTRTHSQTHETLTRQSTGISTQSRDSTDVETQSPTRSPSPTQGRVFETEDSPRTNIVVGNITGPQREVAPTEEYGERTETKTTRSSITHTPMEFSVSESRMGETEEPQVVEQVTIRSTRSSVANSPASPGQREFPPTVTSPEDIIHYTSEPFSMTEETSGMTTSQTTVRTSVRTVTSATIEGEPNEDGEQIVTRITRQTITKSPATSPQAIENLPAITRYASTGPEIVEEGDNERTVTRVTTTTIVSHPVTTRHEMTSSFPHVGHTESQRSLSPSQQEFQHFATETLGDEGSQTIQQFLPEGVVEITRTQSRSDDKIITSESRTITRESEDNNEYRTSTTITRSTVVTHREPELAESSYERAESIDYPREIAELAGIENISFQHSPSESPFLEEPADSVEVDRNIPPALRSYLQSTTESDTELEELEQREPSEERTPRGGSADQLTGLPSGRPRSLLPTTSISMPSFGSDDTVTETQPDLDTQLRSVSNTSFGSDIPVSSGRVTSESSRQSSPESLTGSDLTIRSGSSATLRQASQSISTSSSSQQYESALASPNDDSYHTASENKQSSTEYDTAATDFSSTPYQTAGEGGFSSPGSRQLSAVGSPVGTSGRRDDLEVREGAERASEEISKLTEEVLAEYGQRSISASGSRRQPSWEMIGPDDINEVRQPSPIDLHLVSDAESEDDFEHISIQEIAEVSATDRPAESTGVVSEPETVSRPESQTSSQTTDDTVIEVPIDTPAPDQQPQPIIEEAGTPSTEPSFLTAQQSERVTEETEHTEDDTFDMRHSVPGRRNRTPDPTPELPEERSWTRADFGFRPTLGMRQYSESEFSEAELRDLARRPSDVSIQDFLPRPISPEPESSASPQVDLDQGINIQSTPEDEEAPEYLPPLEDIQEEKESTSGESINNVQSRNREVASSASGSLQEFERLEQQVAVEEKEDRSDSTVVAPATALYSPDQPESMSHSESNISSDTASTVIERTQSDMEDVESQHTDRDVNESVDIMSDSLTEPEFTERLRETVTTRTVPDTIMTDSLTDLGGITDVRMSDSLESETMRRVMEFDASNIMADSLIEEHFPQEGQIEIPPADISGSTGDVVTVRRYLVTGHPSLNTVSFSGPDSVNLMESFLMENQALYPDLQIYESEEEILTKETENTTTHAVTTTRIVKRRQSDLNTHVETVTFSGHDSEREMAKFLSHTMPLDFNETETIECETQDESGDVTRTMTRRLSRVDVASGFRRTSSASLTGSSDIPQSSAADVPSSAHSGESRSFIRTSSQPESTVMASSFPEEETEVLEETVVTHDEPIEEEGSEEVDLTEHDVKQQQKQMETEGGSK